MTVQSFLRLCEVLMNFRFCSKSHILKLPASKWARCTQLWLFCAPDSHPASSTWEEKSRICPTNLSNCSANYDKVKVWKQNSLFLLIILVFFFLLHQCLGYTSLTKVALTGTDQRRQQRELTLTCWPKNIKCQVKKKGSQRQTLKICCLSWL